MTALGAPRILVVDDDREFRRSLAKIFRKADFDIQVAANGNQAAALLNKAHFDLLVLDLEIPGKSGLELLREVKMKARDTAVIIVTAHGETNRRDETLAAGAFEYLDKPVKRHTILEAAQRALAQRH